MVVAVLQVISLGQLVERLVFDSPAPVPCLINHLGGISIQFGTGPPDPWTVPGGFFFPPAPDPLLHPLFLGTDDPNRLAIFFTELQVFDFPQLRLTVVLLIVKRRAG